MHPQTLPVSCGSPASTPAVDSWPSRATISPPQTETRASSDSRQPCPRMNGLSSVRLSLACANRQAINLELDTTAFHMGGRVSTYKNHLEYAQDLSQALDGALAKQRDAKFEAAL